VISSWQLFYQAGIVSFLNATDQLDQWLKCKTTVNEGVFPETVQTIGIELNDLWCAILNEH